MWAASSDRTNAVAALLTVPFRRHFAGGKPLVLVTATKSHAGKGTLIEFVQLSTAKADVLYEDKDWPMQNSLLRQLAQQPEVGPDHGQQQRHQFSMLQHFRRRATVIVQLSDQFVIR